MPYQPGDRVRHRRAMVTSTILGLEEDYETYGIYRYTTDEYGDEEFCDDFEYDMFELIERDDGTKKPRYKEREYIA